MRGLISKSALPKLTDALTLLVAGTDDPDGRIEEQSFRKCIKDNSHCHNISLFLHQARLKCVTHNRWKIKNMKTEKSGNWGFHSVSQNIVFLDHWALLVWFVCWFSMWGWFQEIPDWVLCCWNCKGHVCSLKRNTRQKQAIQIHNNVSICFSLFLSLSLYIYLCISMY